MSPRIEVLVRIEDDLLDLGHVNIPDDADPTAHTVVAALRDVAYRVETWKRFRDAIGDVA